jgi:hypothetical protein
MLKHIALAACLIAGIAAFPTAASGDTDVVKGKFESLAAPWPGIGGKAKLRRIDDRNKTNLIADLTGLTPGQQYHGHLHIGVCADRGPHYRNVPDGHPHPPNELHLMTFTADADGNARVKSKARWIARSEARSVFIHRGPAGHHGAPKVACAEFPDIGDDDQDDDDQDDDDQDDDD